jgi:hypothetical protein
MFDVEPDAGHHDEKENDEKENDRHENGRKPQIKIETVERLAKPFGLEVWQILAPKLAVASAKMPRARSRSVRGPRVK